ncbi:cytochrome P450 [Lentzea tibetensis]|uniref:Cytochrome P450 n=1 Tax=Lentzea tibetensis TaxID=2591470 RepID=A0A563F201_9PSEU|nr:cytochrome P450 [Lentzea tibetensis]TWP53394.1 cytochrome P450 [Lentzea tibetensis]
MTAPGRLPLLGHVLRFGRNPIGFLQELRAHGDVVVVHLGPRRVHVVNSPELIRQVLVTGAHDFERGEVFAQARRVLGDGLATSDEPVHMRQRRVMQPAFHRDRVTACEEVMRSEVVAFASALVPGERIALDRALQRLTLTVTAKALFRTALGERAVAEVQRSLGPVLNSIARRALLPGYGRLPSPRFDQALHRLTSVVDDVVAAYRASGTDHGDLLSMLVSSPMSAGEVRTQVINILMAGTETTATTLSWAFYELGRYRGPFDVDHVLRETLRLHTPIWLLTRRATRPVQLGDTELPAGAEVLVSLPALHRDPVLFPDPMRFDPGRWAEAEPPQFLPFGAGGHKCIGEGFAWSEMTIAITEISARWQLELAPGHEVREVARAFLRPNALPVVPVQCDGGS